MIHFTRWGSQYKVEGDTLPVAVLTKYPHEIGKDGGKITLQLSHGDYVVAFPTKDDKESNTNGKRRQIAGFGVVGECLCCRFVEGGSAHDVELVSQIDLFTAQSVSI